MIASGALNTTGGGTNTAGGVNALKHRHHALEQKFERELLGCGDGSCVVVCVRCGARLAVVDDATGIFPLPRVARSTTVAAASSAVRRTIESSLATLRPKTLSWRWSLEISWRAARSSCRSCFTCSLTCSSTESSRFASARPHAGQRLPSMRDGAPLQGERKIESAGNILWVTMYPNTALFNPQKKICQGSDLS